jgi:hypothetical protein
LVGKTNSLFLERRVEDMKKVLVVVVALTLVLSASAFAGQNAAAKGAVHVLPHASRSCVKNFPVITGCGEIITTEAGADVDAFPVFFELAEYQGFDYAMTWPGLYSSVFTSCSDLTIGGITWPGEGVSHAWYTCQAEPIVVPGWAWIYDYGYVELVAHPTAGGVIVGDCGGILDEIICLTKAGIGGYFGDDPCLPTATEPSTWGGIKGIFK